MDTNENFYYPYGIKYKGLKLCDVAQTNIALHFSDVADYIDEALGLGGKHICNFSYIIKPTFQTLIALRCSIWVGNEFKMILCVK